MNTLTYAYAMFPYASRGYGYVPVYPQTARRLVGETGRMQYASDSDGGRVEASPLGRATCPACGATTIAKCGEIVMWHWAHEADRECDPWSEPETEWHRGWKAEFPVDQREVVIGPHRADVVAGRTVIEFQHSSLSTAQARERETFYRHQVGRIAWVFDASTFLDNILFSRRLSADELTFRWLWPRKTHALLTAPLYWDLASMSAERRERNGFPLDGTLMLRVRGLHVTSKHPAGWGRIGRRELFVKHYRDASVIAQETERALS